MHYSEYCENCRETNIDTSSKYHPSLLQYLHCPHLVVHPAVQPPLVVPRSLRGLLQGEAAQGAVPAEDRGHAALVPVVQQLALDTKH